MVDSLADPAVSQKLREIGLAIPERDRQSPDALKAFQIRGRQAVAAHQTG
jgi:hypothetical protein